MERAFGESSMTKSVIIIGAGLGGLAAALPVSCSLSVYGRGERSRTDTSQQFPLSFSLAVPCVADHVAAGL